MTLLRRLLLVLCLIAAPAAAWADIAKITFILTNDIYLMGETVLPDGQRRGGFARLAAVVKAERERARAAGGHVVLAHGGDTLSPSLMSGFDYGSHIITLTNAVKPEIFVPGNHEFDFGKAIFLRRMAEATFPRFAANLRVADGTPLPGFSDRAMVTLDGVRIGLTGATYDDAPRTSSPEDLKFLPTVPAMKAQAEALRRDGADFVVVVMHADRAQAVELAETNTVDLILTGHNHDLLVRYDGRRAMAESGHDAHYVTLIDVTIETKDQDGRRAASWWPQFRIVDTATVTPDPEVAALVEGFERELNREMDVPLSTTAVELDTRNATMRGREAAMGNLVADAARQKTHADVAVMNGGGIRGGRVYAPGSAITRRDVLAELPFRNRVVTIEITGAALRAAIENGLSRLPAAAGRFPHVSGMAVEYDARRAAGERVLTITVGGAPLDPSRTYRVATNDFMARGGDGYATFAAAKPLLPMDDAPLVANEVMVYLRELGTIRSTVDGRMKAR
jgi:5'-nucleotidase/UDP-sugar diphosphatase